MSKIVEDQMNPENSIDIRSRIGFLREMLLYQGHTSLGQDSLTDNNNGSSALNDTKLHCYVSDNIVTCGSYEMLLDTLFTTLNNDRMNNYKKDPVMFSLSERYSDELELLKQLYPSRNDFEFKDIIGRGQFGEVRVVQEKGNERILAMKTLTKSKMIDLSGNIACFREERDIMVRAKDSPWVANLEYAFQDYKYLYLIMTFYAGGDLLNIMERYDPMEEKMARFYLSEIATSIHSIHELGYIHRDIKPENILIDISGHIKLADFGSAASLSKDGRIIGQIAFPVGTPEYISPEVLSVLDAPRCKDCKLYGRECDWWSMGVLAYEMLVGTTPFEGDTRMETHSNIQNYKNSLVFPQQLAISKLAINLIKSLCTDIEIRIGFTEILGHPFFADIHWDNLLCVQPPHIPQVRGPDDVSNFDKYEFTPAINDDHDTSIVNSASYRDSDLYFIGFSYLPTPRSTTLSNAEQLTLLPTHDASPTHDAAEPNCGMMSSNTRVFELQNILNDKIRELDVSMGEKGIMQKERILMEDKVQDLRKKLEIEQDERQKMEKRAFQLLEEIRGLSKQVQDLHEQGAVQKATIEQQVVLNQLTQEKELAQQRAKRLEEELQHKRQALDELMACNEEIKRKLSQSKENKRLESLLCSEKLNKVAEEAKVHITKQMNEIKHLQAELADRDKQLSLDQDKLINEQNRVANLALQINALQRELENSKNQLPKNTTPVSDNNDDVIVSLHNRVNELEQEILHSAECKEDLESSGFRKDRERQDIEQEMLETLSERDRLQEELDSHCKDLDLKDKELSSQQAMMQQLEDELSSTKSQLKLYDEDISSRLQYRRKSRQYSDFHVDGTTSDTEVKSADNTNKTIKEVKDQFTTETNKLKRQLDEEIAHHTQTRTKLSVEQKKIGKKLKGMESALKIEQNKFSNDQIKHKETVSNFENRNDQLEKSYKNTLNKVSEMKRTQTNLEQQLEEALKRDMSGEEEMKSKDSKLKDSESEIKRLNKDIAIFTKLKRDFEESITSLQSELRTLRNASQRNEKQLQETSKRMKEVNLIIEERDSTIEALQLEIQHLTENTQNVEDTSNYRTKIEELTKELRNEQQFKIHLEVQLTEMKTSLQHLSSTKEKEINSYQIQETETNEKLQSNLALLREAEKKIDKYEITIENSQKKEMETAHHLLGFKHQVKQLEQNLTSTVESNKKQESTTIQQLNDQLNQLSQDLAYVKASKEESEVRHTETIETCQRLENENASLKVKCNELQAAKIQLTALGTEYRALKDAEFGSSMQLNELREQLAKTSKDSTQVEKVQSELNELKITLISREDEIKRFQRAEKIKLIEMEKIEQSRLESDKFRDEIRKLQVDKFNTEQELVDSRTRINIMELDNVQSTNEKSKMEESIIQKERSESKAKQDLTVAKDDVKILQMKVRQLERGQFEEPERIKELEDEIDQYKQRILELNDLKDKLSSIEAERESQQRIINALREDNSKKEMNITTFTEEIQSLDERNKVLANQIDLQYEERRKQTIELSRLRGDRQLLLASERKLAEDLNLRNQELEETSLKNESNNNEKGKEVKALREKEYRLETQLQQTGKLLDYITESKSLDAIKTGSKNKKKETEVRDWGSFRLPRSKQSIKYPPRAGSGESEVTHVHSAQEVSSICNTLNENIPFNTNLASCKRLSVSLHDIHKSNLSESTPNEGSRKTVIDLFKKSLTTSKKAAGMKSKIRTDLFAGSSNDPNATYTVESSSESDLANKRAMPSTRSTENLPSATKKSRPMSEELRSSSNHLFVSMLCKVGINCAFCKATINSGEMKKKCEYCKFEVHPRCSDDFDTLTKCHFKNQQQQQLAVPGDESFATTLASSANTNAPPNLRGWFSIAIIPSDHQSWEKYYLELGNDKLELFKIADYNSAQKQSTRSLILASDDQFSIFVQKNLHKRGFLRTTKTSIINLCFTISCNVKLTPSHENYHESFFIQCESKEIKETWVHKLEEVINFATNRRNSQNQGKACTRIHNMINQVGALHFHCAVALEQHRLFLLGELTGLFVISFPSWAVSNQNLRPIYPASPHAPFSAIKIVSEFNLVLFIAGRDKEIVTANYDLLLEAAISSSLDKKKQQLKFQTIPQTQGCQFFEYGKINGVSHICAYHKNSPPGTNYVSIFTITSSGNKQSLELLHTLALKHCTSILLTESKIIFGSQSVITYNPTKQISRESEISCEFNGKTTQLRHPLAILQLADINEFIIVYTNVGVRASRNGGNLTIEENIQWLHVPIAAWIDANMLYVSSHDYVTIYPLPFSSATNSSLIDISTNIANSKMMCHLPHNLLYFSRTPDSALLHLLSLSIALRPDKNSNTPSLHKSSNATNGDNKRQRAGQIKHKI